MQEITGNPSDIATKICVRQVVVVIDASLGEWGENVNEDEACE
jgi:hypothetical protein